MNKTLAIVILILGSCAIIALYGLFIMISWNGWFPWVFGESFPRISFLQALALSFILGGFKGLYYRPRKND